MSDLNLSENQNVVKNYYQFQRELIQRIRTYTKEFAQKTHADLGNDVTSLYWKKDLHRLIRRHQRALKRKYYSICLVSRRKHRQQTEQTKSELFVLTKPFEQLQSCHEIFLSKFDQLLKKKKIGENLVNYTRTAEEFKDEVKKIQAETLNYFQDLFDTHTCLSSVLPSRMVKKTSEIRQKIIATVKSYCEWICQRPNRYAVTKKQARENERFSVLKTRKSLQRWSRGLEKIFWQNEMKKVNFINRPHKKKKALVDLPKDCALYLRDVFKFYSNGIYTSKALSNINIEIKTGEFVLIFGESGSGKTTLLNILSGIDRASDGYVYCDGKDLTCLTKTELTRFRKKNVGYIFQQCCLLPNLTVQENIEIGANLQTDYAKKIDITLLLKDVGMLDKKDSLPIELSGGQQQRVAVARAIAKNPLILFADEPTAALDETTANNIMELFINLKKKYNTTFVIVSHNEAFGNLADKIIYIKNGRVDSVKVKSSPS